MRTSIKQADKSARVVYENTDRVIITLSNGAEFILMESSQRLGQLRIQADGIEVRPESSVSIFLRSDG